MKIDLTSNNSENSSINNLDAGDITSLEQENGDSISNHSLDNELEDIIDRNNLNNELYLVSQDREQHQKIEEMTINNNLIANRSNKNFKSEWVDTFYIPINYNSTAIYNRQPGETLEWIGLYWSILFCFNENKCTGCGALFIGYKHTIQNIESFPLNIRYQFLILDKNDVNISNIVLCK